MARQRRETARRKCQTIATCGKKKPNWMQKRAIRLQRNARARAWSVVFWCVLHIIACNCTHTSTMSVTPIRRTHTHIHSPDHTSKRRSSHREQMVSSFCVQKQQVPSKKRLSNIHALDSCVVSIFIPKRNEINIFEEKYYYFIAD